jgi:protein involved in sex pheromone biosynthesis
MNKIVILAIVLITLLLANCKSAQNSNNINTTLANSENKTAQVPKREINYTWDCGLSWGSESAQLKMNMNETIRHKNGNEHEASMHIEQPNSLPYH